MDNKQIEELFSEQLQAWESARNNYMALGHVKTKELELNGHIYQVQFNPARIVSSGAKVDDASIRERKCFLCEENRPQVQKGLAFDAENHYTVLINPFPIFPKHLTIPDTAHVPQRIARRFGDMLEAAKWLNDYIVFYNGPKCGASAPDHIHFQAGNKGFLPIEKDWEKHIGKVIIETGDIKLFTIDYGFPALVIRSGDKSKATALFDRIYNLLPEPANDETVEDTEPMMNILAWYENSSWIAVVIPRTKHRPDCYFGQAEENILISPASVDLGGVFITPLEKDFEKITARHIAGILSEVCMDKHSFEQMEEKLKTDLQYIFKPSK